MVTSKFKENYLSINELALLNKEATLVVNTNPFGLIRLGKNNNELLKI